MLGSYVCRQCRHRLSRRIAPVRAPQWQPRATFFSLRGNPHNDAEPTQPEAPSQPQREDAHDGSRKVPPIPAPGLDQQSQQPRRVGRYLQQEGAEYDDRQQEGAVYDDPPRQAAEAVAPAHQRQEQGIAANIQKLLDSKAVDSAWALFERTYTSIDCEALRNPPQGDVALLANGTIFSNLLRAATHAQSWVDPPKVTPTAVLLRYEQLGLARDEHWTQIALRNLTHETILAINSQRPAATQRPLPDILSELLSVWRLFFQSKGLVTVPLNTARTAWNLPATEALPDVFDERDFGMRLQQFLRSYQCNAELAFCAVYFYTISEAFSVDQSLDKDAAPFIQFLERLLASSHVDSTFIHTKTFNRFQNLDRDTISEIVGELNTAPRKAISALASRGETSSDAPKGDRAANLEAFYLKRIARGELTKDSAAMLDHLWKEVRRERSFQTDGKLAIPRRIYNAFLAGFLVHREAPRSVEVWNHMMAHGIKPDLQSWVALLDGCGKAKDLDGLNAMWTRMMKSGVEPDNYAWTSRIHGLISLGQVNAGLAALDEMGKRWMSVETAMTTQGHSKNHKGKRKPPPSSKSSKMVNNCAKPSIEVINAAINALTSLNVKMAHDKKVAYVQKILAWAGAFGIRPDAITYNSLIHMYCRAGQTSVASKILQQMEAQGIESDLATYGMLITASFENGAFNGLSESQQSDKIIQIFDAIEASGLKLTQQIFGTAIDRLLREQLNTTAVRRILDYMKKRNIAPSARIYTFIIRNYFQQEPPAILAADALVDQLFTNPRMDSDRFLLERIMEGYALSEELGRMMTVLTRMSARGSYPSWASLHTILTALLRDGDYDRARDLVRDVKNGKGGAEKGIIGSLRDQKHFYHLVEQANLGDMDAPRTQHSHTSSKEPEADPFRDQSLDPSSDPNSRTEEQWLDPEAMGNFTLNAGGRDETGQYDQAQDGQENMAAQQPPAPHEEDVYDSFLTDDHGDSRAKGP